MSAYTPQEPAQEPGQDKKQEPAREPQPDLFSTSEFSAKRTAKRTKKPAFDTEQLFLEGLFPEEPAKTHEPPVSKPAPEPAPPAPETAMPEPPAPKPVSAEPPVYKTVPQETKTTPELPSYKLKAERLFTTIRPPASEQETARPVVAEAEPSIPVTERPQATTRTKPATLEPREADAAADPSLPSYKLKAERLLTSLGHPVTHREPEKIVVAPKPPVELVPQPPLKPTPMPVVAREPEEPAKAPEPPVKTKPEPAKPRPKPEPWPVEPKPAQPKPTPTPTPAPEPWPSEVKPAKPKPKPEPWPTEVKPAQPKPIVEPEPPEPKPVQPKPIKTPEAPAKTAPKATETQPEKPLSTSRPPVKPKPRTAAAEREWLLKAPEPPVFKQESDWLPETFVSPIKLELEREMEWLKKSLEPSAAKQESEWSVKAPQPPVISREPEWTAKAPEPPIAIQEPVLPTKAQDPLGFSREMDVLIEPPSRIFDDITAPMDIIPEKPQTEVLKPSEKPARPARSARSARPSSTSSPLLEREREKLLLPEMGEQAAVETETFEPGPVEPKTSRPRRGRTRRARPEPVDIEPLATKPLPTKPPTPEPFKPEPTKRHRKRKAEASPSLLPDVSGSFFFDEKTPSQILDADDTSREFPVLTLPKGKYEEEPQTGIDHMAVKPRKRRWPRYIALLLAMIIIGGIVAYLVLSSQATTREENRTVGYELLDAAIALIQESDQVVVALDGATTAEVTQDNLTERKVLLQRVPTTMDALNSAEEDAQAALELFSSDDDKELAQHVINAAANRRDMLTSGAIIITKDIAAMNSALYFGQAWEIIVNADAELRATAELSRTGGYNELQEAIARNNAVLASLAQASELLVEAKDAFLEVDYSSVTDYIALRTESIQLSIAIDQAMLDTNLELVTEKSAEFELKDAAVVHAAGQIPPEPLSLIFTAYDAAIEEARIMYNEARANAVEADKFIREYVGVETQTAVQ